MKYLSYENIYNNMEVNIDLNQNKWVTSIPKNNVDNVINKYLRLGYIVSTLSQQTINPMNGIFDPIINNINSTSKNNDILLKTIEERIGENIGSLRTTIDNLIYQSANSSIKGKIAEQQISNIIVDNFPDDTVEITAQKDYESDIQLKTSDGITLYIEVKMYKASVTTSQIDKFKRDIIRSGIKVGILISTTSGITGKKRLEFDLIDNDKYIIYVPNTGFEVVPIIWSVLFAKQLHKISNKKKEIDIGILMDCYRQFESLYTNFSNMKYNLIKVRKNIVSQLDDLHIDVLKIDNMIEKMMQECNLQINRVLDYKKEILFSEKEIIEFLSDIEVNKDKRQKQYKLLYEYCKKNKYTIYNNEDSYKWIVKKDNQKIFETKYTKTKVDIVIPEKGITIQIINNIDDILDSILLV